MLESVVSILSRCGSSSSVLPPTELFNEGWLLCLVLDSLDRNRAISHPLAFEPGARWYSEALLPSRFLPRSRDDDKAESFTHADGVIGHFEIVSGKRGDARLMHNVKQFVVTEAKLGSHLSSGTKNAPGYDQAARNVACMAHMLAAANVDPRALDRLAFFVVAPEAQLRSGVFAKLVTKESIKKKVQVRVRAYNGAHDGWFEQVFLPTLNRAEVATLAWEAVLNSLPIGQETDALHQFYAQCLRVNPLRANSRPNGLENSQ